jgi:hypothetical protein
MIKVSIKMGALQYGTNYFFAKKHLINLAVKNLKLMFVSMFLISTKLIGAVQLNRLGSLIKFQDTWGDFDQKSKSTPTIIPAIRICTICVSTLIKASVNSARIANLKIDFIILIYLSSISFESPLFCDDVKREWFF